MEPNIAELENETKGTAPPPAAPGAQGNRVASRWASRQFRRRLLGAAAIVAVVVLGLIYHYYGRISTDDAQVDGHITRVASKIYGNVYVEISNLL